MPVDAAKLDRAAKELAEKIIELRHRRGFTQETLAERSGLSRNQVQNIERCRNNTRDPDTGRHGKGNPTLDTVFQLADALDIPVAILIDPDAKLPPPEPAPTEPLARPPRRR